MAHLIYLICLSIYLSVSFAKIGLKCTYIWGRFCAVHLRPNLKLASNIQLSELSDWLRQITWENKLNLPQMYIHLRPIHTFEADSVHLRPNLKSASNVQLSDWLSEIGLKCTAVWLANSVCQPIRQLYIWGRFCTFEAKFEISLKCTAVWLANSVCQPIRQLYIWGRFCTFEAKFEISLKCTAVWLANSVCQPIRQLYIWFGLKCTESASNWKCSNL